MGGMVGGAMGGWSTAPKSALPELEQRLNSLLVTPVKLPLNDDMSVREALVSISKEIGLPVIFSPDVDERMLERKLDRSYDAEFPVASLLKMVLSDANLTYRREDGVVRIVMDYRNQGGNDDAIWIMQDQQTMSQISALLGEKIKGDLEFVAVPAREVVATLSRETSILIDLLPNDDWDWDEPITLTALSDTATVRDVIGMIDPNVSYTVKNGRLTLMSIDSANEVELHRIYWIDSFGPGSVDVLTNLIEQSIEPDSWLNQGGQSRIGTLVGGDGSRNGVMVTAPYSTHEQIEKLLQTLRESGFYSAQ